MIFAKQPTLFTGDLARPTRLIGLCALVAALCPLTTAGPAFSAPYDGPRISHDADGQPIALFAIPDRFTVTRAPGVASSWPPEVAEGEPPPRIELGPWALVHDGPLGPPRYRTDAYLLERDPEKSRPDAGAVARALLALPTVAVAGPLYRTTNHPLAPWRAMTSQVLLQLNDEEDLSQLQVLAARLGIEDIEPRGLAPHQFLLRTTRTAAVDPVELAMLLHEAPITRWAQVDWLEPREPRFVPDDELFADQWHLDNIGQSGGIPDHDVNCPEAWDTTLGDPDIVIAVLDSGIELDHPDLEDNLVPGYDFIDGDSNPSTGDSHGTKVAGTAAAPAQGLGVVGTCPGCRIMPIRMLGTSHSGEADAHDFAVANGASVINNSWGPIDGTGQATSIPAVVATAIDFATTMGRSGRGVAIFWAAGNGHPQDTCSDDGYVAYPSTIAVGGSTNEGTKLSLSELCPELDLTAPTSGGTAALTTTTMGGDGYTSSFGGTSGAAPVAAGVGALVLSGRPDLSWGALRALLHDTAVKIDPGDGFYDDSGHSDTYGYGRIDAEAAIESESAVLSVGPTTASCTAELSALLLLPNKEGMGSVDVVATSDSEDGEVFVLDEGELGVYEGVIPLSDKAPVVDDGFLSVGDGDEVSVLSDEVADGVEIEIDCRPPEILNPSVDAIGAHDARILWQTDELADGWALWTDSDGNGDGNADDAIDLVHQVWANGLTPCTEYQATIASSDAVDNVAELANAVSWHTGGDPASVPDDAPDDADPCDPSTWTTTGNADASSDDNVLLVGQSDFWSFGSSCSCSAGRPMGMLSARGLLVLILGMVAVGRQRRRPTSL